MARLQSNQMMLPNWQNQALAESGPLSRVYLEHATWRNQPSRAHQKRRTHSHDVFHLVSFTGGQGSFLLDDQEHRTTEQVLILTEPGQAHSFSGDLDDKHLYNEITFRGLDKTWPSLLKSFFELELTVPAIIPLSIQAFNHLEDQARQMVFALSAIPSPTQARISCAAYLYQALFSVFQLTSVKQEQLADNDEWDDLRKWIELNAEDNWGLELLAQRMHCSVKHVSRQFSRRFGVPPLRYKNQVLMQRAQVLLRSTALSLTEISEQLGFTDAHYFNRLFRQTYEIAPARYRKQVDL